MLGELSVQDLWWLARTAPDDEMDRVGVIQASYANRFSGWSGLAQTTFSGAVFAYLAVAANYLTSAAAKPPPAHANVIAIVVSSFALALTIFGLYSVIQAARSTRLYFIALRRFVQLLPS
jgi:hypothetical protein